MEDSKKIAAGATLVLLLIVGVRVYLIYRERHAPYTLPASAVPERMLTDDDTIFPRRLLPSTFKDAKSLAGKTVWVQAGGQMEYYPYTGGAVQYAHSSGTLMGDDELHVKNAILAVAPKSATFRIPGGDKHLLLVFTKAGDDKDDKKEYAVPVGFEQGGEFTFYLDEMLLYDNPRTIYHWPQSTWVAIDKHIAVPGMTEKAVMLSLGQVSSSESQNIGNRTVEYFNVGHPVRVIFANNVAAEVKVVNQ